MDFIDHRSTANFIFSLSATDEKLRIKSDGNVGIGVSNPSTKLEVDGVITTAGLTTTANINFGDNDKAIFGAGSELEIYSDGTSGIIKDAGSGDIKILADDFYLQNAAGNSTLISVLDTGKVGLGFSGSEKLATTSTGINVTGDTDTSGLFRFGVNNSEIANNYVRFKPTGAAYIDHNTVGQVINFRLSASSSLDTTPLVVNSTGIDVTGTVKADGLEVEAATPVIEIDSTTSANLATLQFATSGTVDSKITHQASTGVMTIDSGRNASWGGKIDFVTDTDTRMRIANNGDISFYEDTGTTAKFFWDASAEDLQIGGNFLNLSAVSSGTTGGRISGNGGGTLRLASGGVDALYVVDGGKVGIGTSSLIAKMHVKGAGTSSSTNAIFAENSSGAGLFAIRDNGDAFILGNTGIGTSSPSTKLQVTGNSSSRNTIVSNVTLDGGTTVSNPYEGFGFGINFIGRDYGNAVRNYASINTFMQSKSSSSGGGDAGFKTGLSFYTNGGGASGTNPEERMRIDASGNFNLVSSSSGLIDFNFTDASLNNYARIQGGKSGSGVGDLRFFTYSGGIAERMRIDSSGNVQVKGGNELRVYRGDNATYGSMKYLTGSGGLQFNDLNGDGVSFIRGSGATESMRIDGSGNLLVGTTTTNIATEGTVIYGAGNEGVMQLSSTAMTALYINRSNDGELVQLRKNNATVGSIGTEGGNLVIDGSAATSKSGIEFSGAEWLPRDAGANTDGAISLGDATNRFKDLYLSGTAYTNALGVGTTSPAAKVDIVDTTADVQLRVYKFDGTNNTRLTLTADDSGAKIHYRDATNGGTLRFNNNAGEMARFDSSGNLLVGTTDSSLYNNATGEGVAIHDDHIQIARSGNSTLSLNRQTSDGTILDIRKDGSTVGSIGTKLSDGGTSDGELFITSGNTGLFFDDIGSYIRPCNGSAALRDNIVDLGKSDSRFKDIYASNGTIQTSDRNEKQNIEELSDAEQRVAVACKGLLRKFRWKSSVADKGDEARIHFGIIAQDLQDAFTAEGLDAGRYGMFINSTWTDEKTGEERSRMGVRYSELLAFIIAAI